MKELGSRSKHSSSDRNLLNSSNKKKRSRIDETDSEESSDNAYNVEKTEIEAKKSLSNGLDVFEFDEYDNLDYTAIIKKNSNNSSSKDKWNLLNSKPNYGNAKNCRVENEMEDDESDLPLSVLKKKYRSSCSDKRIRLQGKNGVLKVMHKKKRLHSDDEDEKEPEPIVVHKKKKLHSDAKDEKEPELIVVHKKKKLHSDVEDEKEPEPIIVHEKKKLHKDAEDGQTSGSEDSINTKKEKVKPILYSRSKRAGKIVVSKSKDESHSKQEAVKSEILVKKVTPFKEKESKVNRGSGTEKQILREKIKSMLLDAGWTIDYRPRRGRAYLDSVYINPAGTGYWSIVKAYDAFQKEEEENSKDGKDFTPLPDELLDILTRQTRKKMERERTKSEGEDCEDDYKEEKRSSSVKNGRKSRKLGRSTLLVRGSHKGVNSENDGFVSYPGKRTLLSWLIDLGVVEMGENVEYMNRRKTQAMQKGWITKDGIHCGCCNKIVTVSKFEAHAGSKLQQPFLNIVLKSGKSLMQCLNDAWNKQGELERKGFYEMDVDGDDPNDDTCGICGDGGDLICCDGCPSTFHQSCLEIQMLPQGDWHCPNCSCKFCKKTCVKVGGENEVSLVTCCFCQKKYHESCRLGIDVKPIESNYSNFSFCGQKCHELYSDLQKLFGVKHELDSGFSWSLIHRSDISTDDSSVEHSQCVQWNSMLAVAMSVMDECFLPFTDRRSGTNLIRNVVFNCGSNLSRLNYSSFYTAILEKGEEVFCAASIRIHGTQLAEMPFIGTRHLYRRQGMCRRLLSAIESALSSLKVEKLIIPAVAEHMNTWTDVFGFHPLEESHKQELKSMSMVVFPGTDMLQKPVAKQDIPNTVPQGSETVEEEAQKVLSEKPELISSEVKMDSGSEESSVPLDDGCSIDANKETLPRSPVKNDDLPIEPKLSASVDTHIESKVEESIVQVANEIIDKPIEIPTIPSTTISSSVIPSEPKVESSVKESVSVNSHFDTNVQVTNETIVESIEVPAVLSTTVVSSVIPSEPEVNSNSDTDVQVINETIVESIEVPAVLSTTVFSSVIPSEPKVNSNSGTNVQVTNETIVESIEVPAGLSATVVSSFVPREPKVNSISDTNVEKIVVQNDNGIKEDVHTDSMIEIIDVQKNGCEITEVPSNNTVSSDAPCGHELQSFGIKSVSVESHIAIKVKEACADVILETGKHADNDGIQLSGEKEGSCQKEMNTEEKENQTLETS